MYNFLLLLHICNINSLAWLYILSDLQKNIYIMFIFLLFLHLCSGNVLAGLVRFSDLIRIIVFFSFSCCFYVWWTGSSLGGLVHFFFVLKRKFNFFVFLLFLHWEELITWAFGHIRAFSFSDLDTSFVLLDRERVQLWCVGLPFRWKWKWTIHIFVVDHRSAGLPECGPTESSAPETCFFFLFFFVQ